MPHFSLDQVAEAARLGSTVLQGKRARDVLTAYIPTLVGCLRFAEEVAQGLTSCDFYETVQLARDGMRCSQCSDGEVTLQRKAGRRWAFRNVPDLPIPTDLPVPTCDRCGESYVDRKTAGALDAALVPAYAELLRHKAQEALGVLSERGVTQRRVEPLLGLSGGYLSKVRGGKDPSALLVSALMLLASDPGLVDRLERLWSAQADLRMEGTKAVGAGG